MLIHCYTRLFAILLTTFLWALHLFVRSSQRRFSNTKLHTRQTELLLTTVCFVLPFNIRTPSICRTFLKWEVRVLAFSRTLSRPLVYVHSNTCLLLMLVVIDLFGRCSMPLLFHPHGLCFCSFCLLFSCEMILGRFHLRNNIKFI